MKRIRVFLPIFIFLQMLLVKPAFASGFNMANGTTAIVNQPYNIEYVTGYYTSNGNYCNISVIDPDGELVLNKKINYTGNGATVRVDSFSPQKVGEYRIEAWCYSSNGTPAASGHSFILTVIDAVDYYDAKIVPEKTHYTINYPKEKSFRLNFTISVKEYPYSQTGLQRVWFTSKMESGTEIIKYTKISDYKFVKNGDRYIAEGWLDYDVYSKGTAKIAVRVMLTQAKDSDGNYLYVDRHEITVDVVDETTEQSKTTTEKKANPITVKAKKVTVSLKTLKKKNVTVKAKNAFTIKKNVGKVTYKKVSGSKKITISKTGKITVKKKTKKGKYIVKVKVTDAGNNTYKSKSKTVKLTIVVK